MLIVDQNEKMQSFQVIVNGEPLALDTEAQVWQVIRFLRAYLWARFPKVGADGKIQKVPIS